jgi:hypothetical protein
VATCCAFHNDSQLSPFRAPTCAPRAIPSLQVRETATKEPRSSTLKGEGHDASLFPPPSLSLPSLSLPQALCHVVFNNYPKSSSHPTRNASRPGQFGRSVQSTGGFSHLHLTIAISCRIIGSHPMHSSLAVAILPLL